MMQAVEDNYEEKIGLEEQEPQIESENPAGFCQKLLNLEFVYKTLSYNQFQFGKF